MVWRIKPQQKYCDCLNIDYILVSCWKVKCSSTFHLRSSFSLPFCGGTPLAPWTLIEIPRTQFGLHIHSVVDMWLQLLMVYQNVLFFQWKGMNWILSKGRLKKKKSAQLWCQRGQSVVNYWNNPFSDTSYLWQVVAFSYAHPVCETVYLVLVAPSDVVGALIVCHLNIKRRHRFHCERGPRRKLFGIYVHVTNAVQHSWTFDILFSFWLNLLW